MKQISSKYIISKILRDFNITDSSWINDIYEWVGDVIAFTNVNMLYDTAYKKLKIEQGRVILNFSFESILYIQYKNTHIYKTDNPQLLNHCKCNLVCNTEIQYKQNGNVLHFNIDDGEIIVYFLKPLTDENGYPLIPSDINFQESILWYVKTRLILQGKETKINYNDALEMFELYKQRFINTQTLKEINIELFSKCRFNFNMNYDDIYNDINSKLF